MLLCRLNLIYSMRQRVRIDGLFSSWRLVLSGIPQGSILGKGRYRISPRGAVFYPPLPFSPSPVLSPTLPCPSLPSLFPPLSHPPPLEARGPGVLPQKILKFCIAVGEFWCIFEARNIVSNTIQYNTIFIAHRNAIASEGVRHEKLLKCV